MSNWKGFFLRPVKFLSKSSDVYDVESLKEKYSRLPNKHDTTFNIFVKIFQELLEGVGLLVSKISFKNLKNVKLAINFNILII